MPGGTVEEFGLKNLEPKSNRRLILKWTALLVVIVLIFGAGFTVGRQQSAAKNTNSKNTTLDYSSVDQVYDLLKQDFDGDLDQTKLLDGLKQGLVSATGDPY